MNYKLQITSYKLQISNGAHKAPLCVSMGELSWRYATHGAMTEGDYCEFAHTRSLLALYRLPPPTRLRRATSPSTQTVEGEAWVLPHQFLFYDNDVIVFSQYIATGRIFICNS